MHIAIRNSNGTSSIYTMAQLRREAQALTREAKARMRDYYVEFHDAGHASLNVHIVRKDGIGEIIREAI